MIKIKTMGMLDNLNTEKKSGKAKESFSLSKEGVCVVGKEEIIHVNQECHKRWAIVTNEEIRVKLEVLELELK